MEIHLENFKHELSALRPVANNYYNILKCSVLGKAKNNCLECLDDVQLVVGVTNFGFC